MNWNSGITSDSNGTMMLARKIQNSAVRPRKRSCENPYAASAASAIVASVTSTETIMLLTYQPTSPPEVSTLTKPSKVAGSGSQFGTASIVWNSCFRAVSSAQSSGNSQANARTIVSKTIDAAARWRRRIDQPRPPAVSNLACTAEIATMTTKIATAMVDA